MQTRKKVIVNSAATENASPKFCPNQKKMTLVAERKVTDLTASSANKQNAGILLKNDRDEAAKNLKTGDFLTQDENQGVCMAYGASLDYKGSDERDAHCALDTIFSPAFHISKDVCCGIAEKDQMGHEDQAVEEVNNLNCHVTFKKQERNYTEDRAKEPSLHPCDMNVYPVDESGVQINYDCASLTDNAPSNSTCEEEYKVVGNLSSEVSAIYLAMQHSKLECIDESSQDSICVEADEGDELYDFDPYLFIRNLPDLSTVVPTIRPMLLPKQTRSCPSTTLVLDLDETLVHSTIEPCDDADFTFPVNFNLNDHTVYVRCRPYLKDFVERVSSLFEIIIFTASQSIYAEQLLNVLDPKRRLFRHRVYRESCIFVEGNYLKDLSVLGRDLARVIIIDNSPQAFGFQVDNGIPIESWFDNRSDQALPLLLPFLESLVNVEDVRPLIARKFKLREKIAAAACSSL